MVDFSADGRFFDIPVSSDASRYSEKLSASPEHAEARKRLQGELDEFMKIRKTDDSYTVLPFKRYKTKERIAGKKGKK